MGKLGELLSHPDELVPMVRLKRGAQGRCTLLPGSQQSGSSIVRKEIASEAPAAPQRCSPPLPPPP